MPIAVYQIFAVILIYVAYKVYMEIKWYKEDRENERLRDMVDKSMKTREG
ncbi:hypothetical protein LCGC14_1081310 [marine sediment metagenome]|uniref:Uncharacterized protein n=1 Tax=marine sediment metagenome TaxID=412755 RepID=A0A0F9QL19_9ZZZZ